MKIIAILAFFALLISFVTQCLCMRYRKQVESGEELRLAKFIDIKGLVFPILLLPCMIFLGISVSFGWNYSHWYWGIALIFFGIGIIGVRSEWSKRPSLFKWEYHSVLWIYSFMWVCFFGICGVYIGVMNFLSLMGWLR